MLKVCKCDSYQHQSCSRVKIAIRRPLRQKTPVTLQIFKTGIFSRAATQNRPICPLNSRGVEERSLSQLLLEACERPHR